ncbi:MAG: helix-turn-helix domain-containing protein [Ruminococcus sp.]|nr:helix-turn-helix domain-containing protein [Ruminococcus sp.]
MKNTPRPSLVEERFFPFECSDSYGVEEEYRTLHWHQEMEICYIKQGTGTYLINGVEYPFGKGDIFIINNDDFHVCREDQELIMQVVMFDPSFLQSGSASLYDCEYLRPFLEASGSFCNMLRSDAPYTPKLAAVLREIEEEYKKMDKGYELMIKALVLKFLALIVRHFPAEEKAIPLPVSRKAAEKIRDVILYIDEHYCKELRLPELAARFSMSVPYLSSSFRTLTGMPPIEYIIRRRIARAKVELMATEKSILTISGECGFGSLSNFNHLFKTFAGCSPGAYRRA